jgi:hypothetical protein
MSTFPESIVLDIRRIVREWEPKLLALPADVIETRRNNQNRTIRQILGHLIDSASNNIHRTVHLQYRDSPVDFPNYATFGNNDRWIAIQDYQKEEWQLMVVLWKYSNLHLAHVYSVMNPEKLEAEWIAGPGRLITLRAMAGEYVPHLRLHLDEITGLLLAG